MIQITRVMNPVNRVDTVQESLFVGEEYAHMFTILPMKGVSFSDASVTARFVRPDGQEVAPGGYVDTETGSINVLLSPSCYAVSGQYTLYVFAVYLYETVCVYACNGEILPTLPQGGSAESPSEPIIEVFHDPAVDELANTVQTLEGLVIEAQDSMTALQETVSNLPFQRGTGENIGAVFGDENSVANGQYSVGIGEFVYATGPCSLAVGHEAEANGDYSVGIGDRSQANGPQSFASGKCTIAKKRSQLVFGEYNVADPSTSTWSARGTYVEIVGNGTGTSNSQRHNARTLDWNGNEALAGSLTIGKGTADEVTITPAQLKALLALLG